MKVVLSPASQRDIRKIVIYIAEEASPADRDKLRPAAIGLLYIAQDQLKLAARSPLFVP